METPDNLLDFIEARRELGLLDSDPAVEKCAASLERYCFQMIDESLGIDSRKPKPRVDNTDALNRRETEARNNVKPVGYRVTPSMQSRMVRGFDSMLDKAIAEVRRASRDG